MAIPWYDRDYDLRQCADCGELYDPNPRNPTEEHPRRDCGRRPEPAGATVIRHFGHVSPGIIDMLDGAYRLSLAARR